MFILLFFFIGRVKGACPDTDIVYTNGDVLENEYQNCPEITTVHIDQTTTKIGKGAFENATKLSLITSPEFIDGFQIDIYENAFKNIARDAKLKCANCVIHKGAFDSKNLTLMTDIKRVHREGFV